MSSPEPNEELARLDAEIVTLGERAAAAHATWVASDQEWRSAVHRRHALYEQLTRPAPAPAPASAALIGADARASEASASVTETSTHTMQNVLFVLGGLLLGTAAVAFTAVAWATFGAGGRAAILATVTLIVLAIPLVALSRQLRATAETFAAIGLLLVVLDGYAAWYVNLGGVQAMPGSRYAGVVAAITAVVALGYGRATRLVGPGFVSLVAVQPVFLLVAASEGPSATAVSLLCAGTAAINAIVAYRVRAIAGARAGGGASGASGERKASLLTENVKEGVLPYIKTAMIALAWFLFAGWSVVALGTAVVAEASVGSVTDAATAGIALVVASLLGLVAALYGRFAPTVRVAAGAAVVAVAVATAVLATRAWSGHDLLVCALVTLAVAGATTVLGRVTGEPYRTGIRVGGLVVTGLVGAAVAVFVLSAAVTAVANSLPLWTVELVGSGPHTPPYNWELLAAVVAIAAALALNVPQWSIAALGGGVAVVLALPATVNLLWWAPAAIALAAAAALAIVGLVARPIPAAAANVGAAVLAAFAVLTGAARPGLTAVILAGTGAIGITVGAVSRRPVSALVAMGVGLAAVPPAVGAALVEWHVEPWWSARATVAAAGLLIGALVLVRSARPVALPGAFAAVLLGDVVWPMVAISVGGESLAVHMGVSLLLVAGALAVVPATRPNFLAAGLTAGVLPTVGLAIGVLPAVLAVAVFPFTWLDAVWSGRPAGVGLAPSGPAPVVRGEDAIGLALFAVAAGLTVFSATRRVRPALSALGIVAPTTILVALAAIRAPWPAVPAATLCIGLALMVAAALVFTGARATIAVIQGTVYIGSGLAGSLGVEWATLAALGLVIVAAAVIGAVGRTVAWRVVGLVGAVGAAAIEAATAGLAADLLAREIAIPVLAVAVIALFLGARLKEAESTATEAAAHASALVALLFTLGWREHTAALSAVWGLAIGVRALLPGTSRSGRAALAALAAGFELLAWWLLLFNRGVTLIEAYTLPLAFVALLAGWASLRSRPDLRSWVAYGPALAAAFLPSLAAIITTTGDPWRRLALGAGALLIVVLGASVRRQAPVVIGGLVLALVALHELVLLWQLLPGWVPLAIGGLILVGLAITYERRLRDLGRLRTALGRMS